MVKGNAGQLGHNFTFLLCFTSDFGKVVVTNRWKDLNRLSSTNNQVVISRVFTTQREGLPNC